MPHLAGFVMVRRVSHCFDKWFAFKHNFDDLFFFHTMFDIIASLLDKIAIRLLVQLAKPSYICTLGFYLAQGRYRIFILS